MQERKKIAIITGASSGIGKCFAYNLAENGYTLVLIARRKKLLEAIASDLRNIFKISVTVYEIDLSSDEQRKKLITQIQKKFSMIDLLINNAGFGKFGDSSTLGRENAIKMIQVNAIAVTDLSLSLLPQILKSKEKSIINVASVAAFHPSMFAGIYSATKAFVYSFSMSLAAEYEGRLRILTLCPGLTDTGFWKASNVIAPRMFVHSPEEVVKKALKNLGKKDLLIIGYENHIRIFLQRVLSDEVVLKLTNKIRKIIKK